MAAFAGYFDAALPADTAALEHLGCILDGVDDSALPSPLQGHAADTLLIPSCVLDQARQGTGKGALCPGATALVGDQPTASMSSQHSSGSIHETWVHNTPATTHRRAPKRESDPDTEPDSEAEDWAPSPKRRQVKRLGTRKKAAKGRRRPPAAAARTANQRASAGGGAAGVASAAADAAAPPPAGASGTSAHACKSNGTLGIVQPFAWVKTLGFDGELTLAQLNQRILSAEAT